jgi:hypothetical protein
MATEEGDIGAGPRGASGVQEIRDDVRDAAREAQNRVREKTRDVKSDLRSEAEQRAERMTGQLGEHVERVGRALRATSDALEDEGEGRMSAVMASVAEQVERASGYLRDGKPGRMMHDVEDMARRNPGAFIGTAFVTGLLMARFLRASETHGSSGGGSGDGEDRERRFGQATRRESFAEEGGGV